MPEPGIGLLLGGSRVGNGNSFDLLVGGACTCGMVPGSFCNCICPEDAEGVGVTVDLVTGGAVVVDGSFCSCELVEPSDIWEPAGPVWTTVLSDINGPPPLLFRT